MKYLYKIIGTKTMDGSDTFSIVCTAKPKYLTQHVYSHKNINYIEKFLIILNTMLMLGQTDELLRQRHSTVTTENIWYNEMWKYLNEH